MYCTNCGKEIPDDSVFCTFCGEKVEGGPVNTNKGSGMPKITAPKVSAPKNINKKAVAVAGGVAAVVIVGGAAMSLVSSPKAAVAKGIQKTWKAVCTEETGINSYLGMNDINKMIVDGKSSQTISGDVSAKLFGAQFGNAGFKLQLDREKDDKMLVSATGDFAGMDIGTISLYKDKKDIYAAAPDFVDGNFHVNLKELENKLNDDEFLADLLMNHYIYVQKDLDTDYEKFLKDVQDTIKADMKPLYKNMEVKKSEKKSFSMDGKDKKCQGYDVTIKSDDIQKLVEDVADLYIDRCDSAIENEGPGIWTIMDMSDEDMDAEGLYSYITESKENGKEYMREEIKKYTSSIRKDVNLQVYVGPGGRMVSVGSEGKLPAAIMQSISSASGNGKASVSVDLLGTKNPLDDMSIKGELNAGGETLSVKLARNLEDTKTDIDDSLEFSYATNGSYSTSGRTELYGKVDKETGKWEVGVDGSLAYQTLNISAGGTFENVKKGKQFTVTLDDIDLGSLGSGIGAFDLEVSYAVEPLKGGISNTMTKGTVYNVLDMSEDDWYDIGNEISSNASAIGL